MTDLAHPGTPQARVGAGLLDVRMLVTQLPAAGAKLNPRTMMRNPVMFVVEVGAGCGPRSSSPTWPRRSRRAAARLRPRRSGAAARRPTPGWSSTGESGWCPPLTSRSTTAWCARPAT